MPFSLAASSGPGEKKNNKKNKYVSVNFSLVSSAMPQKPQSKIILTPHNFCPCIPRFAQKQVQEIVRLIQFISILQFFGYTSELSSEIEKALNCHFVLRGLFYSFF